LRARVSGSLIIVAPQILFTFFTGCLPISLNVSDASGTGASADSCCYVNHCRTKKMEAGAYWNGFSKVFIPEATGLLDAQNIPSY
jgi:hypothetical protein